MDSKDKRVWGAIDHVNEVYDDDCFGDILNMLDLPVENLEGDGLAEDWASELGPIPSEVFNEMPSPVAQIGVGNGNGGGGSGVGRTTDLLMECGLNDETYQPKCQLIHNEEAFKSGLKPQYPIYLKEKKMYPMLGTFEAPSPDSVLERGSSSSTGKAVTYETKIPIPARLRSKRTRSVSANNPWLRSQLIIPVKKTKKRRPNLSQDPSNESKKCSHCEITKTPQWREGPMGPKTLCNACGVRYRSGRLFPEYRPAASPTFIPSLHSNSHRKVIEMRQKGGGMDDNCVMKKHSSSDSTDTRLCSPE